MAGHAAIRTAIATPDWRGRRAPRFETGFAARAGALPDLGHGSILL